MRALIAAGLMLLAGADAAPGIINARFDQGTAGWMVAGKDYAVDIIAGNDGHAARLHSTSPTPGTRGAMAQRIDAKAWRGKAIMVTARIKLEGASQGELTVAVHRPAPHATGFRDYSEVHDPTPGQWMTVTKLAYVEADALAIEIGAALIGSGAVLADDIAIAEATMPQTPPSLAAGAYLNRALTLIRAQHMRAGEMDWPALEARSRRQVAGAQTPRDTYWAIRAVLGTLGDHHSFLSDPSPAQGMPKGSTAGGPVAVTAPPAPMPTTQLHAGSIGMVALPTLNTFTVSGRADATRYVAVARAGLQRLDAKRLCGWVIDLRDNGGGNMWPMLNAVSPLLGPSPFGAFVTANGTVSRWVRTETGVVIEGIEASSWPRYDPFDLIQAKQPVAVLLSGRTASSGEAVAIAFSGLVNTRRFGEPSAGFTSGNSAQTLSDGALLGIAAVWERDRLGREYRDRLMPDEAVPADRALTAATHWLLGQCTTRSAR